MSNLRYWPRLLAFILAGLVMRWHIAHCQRHYCGLASPMSRSSSGLWEWENVLIAYSYRWYLIREEMDSRFSFEVDMMTHALNGGCEYCRPPRFTVEH